MNDEQESKGLDSGLGRATWRGWSIQSFRDHGGEFAAGLTEGEARARFIALQVSPESTPQRRLVLRDARGETVSIAVKRDGAWSRDA